MKTKTMHSHRGVTDHRIDPPLGSIENLTPGTVQEFCSRLQSVDDKLNEILDRLAGKVKSHYPIGEVAQLTARSPYTVRRWVAEGLVSATRVAGAGPRGRLLIPRAELQRLIGSGLGGAIPETVVASESSE
jgi:hypothetical protein